MGLLLFNCHRPHTKHFQKKIFEENIKYDVLPYSNLHFAIDPKTLFLVLAIFFRLSLEFILNYLKTFKYLILTI